LDEEIDLEYDYNSYENYSKSSFSSRNNPQFLIPSEEDCKLLLTKTVDGFGYSLQELQHSYFRPILEMILCDVKSPVYHEVQVNENYKKRTLEILLLMPWIKIMKDGFEKIMKQNFCLSDRETAISSSYLLTWITTPESELPNADLLICGSHQYWKFLENSQSPWKWLAKLALIFSNTVPSETSVERDFSKGRFKTGDRRFKINFETAFAELLL
jgi:hypothetical protein